MFSFFFCLDDEAEEEGEEGEEEDVLEVDNDGVEAMDAEDRKTIVPMVSVPSATAVPLASPSGSPTISTWTRQAWVPDYIKGMFQDAQTMVWHLVLVILLPSGVGHSSTEDVDLQIESEGTVLSVEHCYPEWVSNQAFLFFLKHTLLEQAKQQWKELPPASKEQAEDNFRDSFACMSASIRTQMALMRDKPGDHTIKATAKIQLDITVKPITPADWQFIGNDTGVRLLFVDLKAPTVTCYEAKQVKELVLPSKKEH